MMRERNESKGRARRSRQRSGGAFFSGASLRPLLLALVGAALFAPLFAVQSAGPLDFWLWIAASAGVATALAFAIDRGLAHELRREVARIPWRAAGWGALSALPLYALFFVGVALVRRVLPFAEREINVVYALKEGVPTARIVLLLVFVIAPAEEIFWRGSLQRLAMTRWGALSGCLGAAAVYAAVHATSGNLLLVAAAGICGLFWGAMYARWRSLPANIVSHALWDVLVFIAAPL